MVLSCDSILVMIDDLLGFTARDRDFMGSGDVTARPRTSDGWKPGQRIGLQVRQLLKKKSKSVFKKTEIKQQKLVLKIEKCHQPYDSLSCHNSNTSHQSQTVFQSLKHTSS